MLPNKVKLVIWDLDETFWKGTLTEGPIQIVPENAAIVKTLNERGIVSSISSKNNFDNARKVLEEHGLWFHFVFPQIEFAPKGSAIAELIERMNLRADNVLFIDDNHLNLKEALYFAPTLMTAHPDDILPHLLGLPETQGKNDIGLTRLHQYKQLETKFYDQKTTSGSNEDFLRECNIHVEIDIDVEVNFDRVVELINRSNQLNFTKLRMESEESIEEFRKQLRSYGYHAGIVKVQDKYGDYGIVGFYMTARFAGHYRLEHFVFSCRIMNMGIEQYVYEHLGKPKIRIVQPVANGLQDFKVLDWINNAGDQCRRSAAVSDAKLLLIGGCDLLQVATYCSTNRVEFVNIGTRGVMIRYDDPGFILSPRQAIAESDVLPMVPCWTKDDVHGFDTTLADAAAVIVSLWESMNGDYMLIDDQVLVRLDTRSLAKHLGRPEDGPYLEHCRFLRLDVDQKLELARRSLDRIAALSTAKNRFVLGAPTGRSGGKHLALRKSHDAAVEAYCRETGAFQFIALDGLVPTSEYVDPDHLTRVGYFAVASELIRHMDGGATQPAATAHAVRGFAEAPSPLVARSSAMHGFADILAASTPLELVDGSLMPLTFA
jgi:FkbH-like protein